MDAINEGILAVLEVYPQKWGTVVDVYRPDNAGFIFVFEDRVWNWSARLEISKALSTFVRRGWLQLLCQDGAWGYIDTSTLRSIPFGEQREEVADKCLHDMRISPSEYCIIVNPEKPALVCGVEDRHLYAKAKKLWRKMPLEPSSNGLFQSRNWRMMEKFCAIERDRATAIASNLMARMATQDTNVASLTCNGNLPSNVCSILKSRDISYARIVPNNSAPDDRDKYVWRSQGGRSVLEKLLSKSRITPDSETDQYTAEDWLRCRVKDRYDAEEKFAQSGDVRTAWPELAAVGSSRAFRRLSLDDKRKVVGEFEDLPFWALKQIFPVTELEVVLGEKSRYLELRDPLSDPDFVNTPEFQKYIEGIVRRVRLLHQTLQVRPRS